MHRRSNAAMPVSATSRRHRVGAETAGADSVTPTRQIEQQLAQLKLPAGATKPVVLFRQADFIERLIRQCRRGIAATARSGRHRVVRIPAQRSHYADLASPRIPLSLLTTAPVPSTVRLSINTMTLGAWRLQSASWSTMR